MEKTRYACRVVRIIDPITYEVMVNMGLGITYSCKVKLAGVRYKKYDKEIESEYIEFTNTKEQIKKHLLGKDLIITFLTDYKDKSGKYLIDLDLENSSFKDYCIKNNILETLK